MKTFEEEIIETLVLANAKIKELAQQNKELSEQLYSINESLTNELTVRHAEIQRLTKEVETLKSAMVRGDDLYDSQLFEGQEVPERVKELTRLRELLKRVYPYIKDCNTDNYEDRSVGIYYDQELANLVTDIDNALNHKP